MLQYKHANLAKSIFNVQEKGGMLSQALFLSLPTAVVVAWYKFHHDLQNTGYLPSSATTIYFGSETGQNYIYALNASDGSLKWKYPTGDWAISHPAVDTEKTVYIGSDDGYVYAVNSDGTLKWRYRVSGYGYVEGGIAIDPDLGRVYFGSLYSNRLYALNKDDGSYIWSYATGGNIISSPAPDYDSETGSSSYDNVIYIGSQDNYLYAVKSDGTLKWKYLTGNDVNSSPAVEHSDTIETNGVVAVGSWDGYLYVLSKTGLLEWKHLTGDYVDSSPAIDPSVNFYFGSWDNYIYSVDHTGTLNWRYLTGDDVASSPAIDSNNDIYCGSYDNKIYALHSNGTLKWSYTMGGSTSAAPAVDSDGVVYIGSDDYNMYAINSDGTQKWKYLVPNSPIDSSPAIV